MSSKHAELARMSAAKIYAHIDIDMSTHTDAFQLTTRKVNAALYTSHLQTKGSLMSPLRDQDRDLLSSKASTKNCLRERKTLRFSVRGRNQTSVADPRH